jgi:hypothetical protein
MGLDSRSGIDCQRQRPALESEFEHARVRYRAEQAIGEVVLTHHGALVPRLWFSTFTTE